MSRKRENAFKQSLQTSDAARQGYNSSKPTAIQPTASTRGSYDGGPTKTIKSGKKKKKKKK